MKKKVCILIVAISVILQGLVFAAPPGAPAAPVTVVNTPLPVKVSNSSAEAVPVSGTVNVAGSVNINGTPNVTVTNKARQLLPTDFQDPGVTISGNDYLDVNVDVSSCQSIRLTAFWTTCDVTPSGSHETYILLQEAAMKSQGMEVYLPLDPPGALLCNDHTTVEITNPGTPKLKIVLHNALDGDNLIHMALYCW